MPPRPPSPDTAAHSAKRGRFSLTSRGRCSLCLQHRNSGLVETHISSLCPSALGPSKVGAGASPQYAFGCQRQAKRSACPTRGWVKPRSPAVQVLAAQALSALRGDVVWFFPHFFRPSISPSSAGQIAPGLWHKPVADGNQGNGPAPGTRPPHAPVPLRRGYGAILSPGRHTGAHRGK